MRSLLAIVLLAVTTAAPAARMYQWVNPLTGTPVLSGTPPAWYRSVQGGPRVRVFENGMLVDDTVIALSPKHSEELREAAFDEAERQAEAEAVKRLERAARREAMRQDESTVAAAPGGGEPQTAGADTSSATAMSCWLIPLAMRSRRKRAPKLSLGPLTK